MENKGVYVHKLDPYLRRASMSLGFDVDAQSPWPRQPDTPSPHVITIPLSLAKMLNPSPQHALKNITASVDK